jgi:hypothetical protein
MSRVNPTDRSQSYPSIHRLSGHAYSFLVSRPSAKIHEHSAKLYLASSVLPPHLSL